MQKTRKNEKFNAKGIKKPDVLTSGNRTSTDNEHKIKGNIIENRNGYILDQDLVTLGNLYLPHQQKFVFFLRR